MPPSRVRADGDLRSHRRPCPQKLTPAIYDRPTADCWPAVCNRRIRPPGIGPTSTSATWCSSGEGTGLRRSARGRWTGRGIRFVHGDFDDDDAFADRRHLATSSMSIAEPAVIARSTCPSHRHRSRWRYEKLSKSIRRPPPTAVGTAIVIEAVRSRSCRREVTQRIVNNCVSRSSVFHRSLPGQEGHCRTSLALRFANIVPLPLLLLLLLLR